MGHRFADQFSLLHASAGVVAYFWSIPFFVAFICHTIFEIIENTQAGMLFIQRYLSAFWPGGKREPDAIINRIGDTVFFSAGWILAAWLNNLGTEQGWYYSK
jgi:hypothetical protein